MAETIYIREASTAQIPFQLFSDGVPIDLSAVAKTEIVLVPQNGTGTAVKYNTTDHAGSLDYIDATNGRVGFTPDGSTDFTYANTPYKVFFWVWTGAAAKYAIPDDEELVIQVSNDYE